MLTSASIAETQRKRGWKVHRGSDVMKNVTGLNQKVIRQGLERHSDTQQQPQQKMGQGWTGKFQLQGWPSGKVLGSLVRRAECHPNSNTCRLFYPGQLSYSQFSLSDIDKQ